MSVQAPAAVVMIRPHHFRPNPETEVDNAFQSRPSIDRLTLATRAFDEVSGAVDLLRSHGVRVHLFEDETDQTPDSVFPNNWVSTHSGGHIALYPMSMPNRRRERRFDVIEMLKREYRVQDVIDYSGLQYDNIFLEGTGAMVLDHLTRIAYVARSARADPIALERFCTNFGYEPLVFDAADQARVPCYHTNVMMCVGTEFAMVGLEMISDLARRQEIAERLVGPGRQLITLTHDQIGNFAGNAIELRGTRGRILALSSRAESSLTADQRRIIEESCTIVPIEVPTIELAGGSVRCMVAGVHLERRPEVAFAGPDSEVSALSQFQR